MRIAHISLHSFILSALNIVFIVSGFQIYSPLKSNGFPDQIAVQSPITSVFCVISFVIWIWLIQHLSFPKIVLHKISDFPYIYVATLLWGPIFGVALQTTLSEYPASIVSVAAIWSFQIPVNLFAVLAAATYEPLVTALKSFVRVIIQDILRVGRLFPRITAFLIGILLSLLLLFCLEITFYVLNLHKTQRSPKQEWHYPLKYVQYDDILGYKPHASIQAPSKLEVDGEVVYEVIYSIDAYHRRITPISYRANRNRFALFFGGSYTFGEGVDDGETLPCYFSEFSPQYMPYNYGFHGYGPQEMLAKLQDDKFQEEIKEKTGILVYTYLNGHVDRAIGSMYVFNEWGANMPFYTIDSQNNLIRKGSFSSGRPIISRFYKVLGKSHFMKYFNVQFPLKITDRHYKLTAKIIEESRNEFRRKFASENFYVVIYPNKTTEKKIIPYFEKANIKYFDYSNFFDPYGSYIITGDGHPSSKAYRMLTEQLSRDIRTDLERMEK